MPWDKCVGTVERSVLLASDADEAALEVEVHEVPRCRRSPALLILLVSGGVSAAVAFMWKRPMLPILEFTTSDMTNLNGAADFLPFCGIATNNEAGNAFDQKHLKAAADAVGAHKVWHYNWQLTSSVHVPGVEFLPMIKHPGHTQGLPTAGENGVSRIVLGWNEPDDGGQAGRDWNLRNHPENYASAWKADMLFAKKKGYTDFVSPAMAHDTCWLDYFLMACEATSGCKDLVTYLAFHRYRRDCAEYTAQTSNMGWRDDLGYILSAHNLKEKYNRRGFQIKGIIMSEFGCLTHDWRSASSQAEQLQYMKAWYRDSVMQVLSGDAEEISKLSDSPLSKWINHNGPDAKQGTTYKLGMCKWQHPERPYTSGADVVKALQSVRSMAWFSIHLNRNYLWNQGELNELGKLYFNTCKDAPTRDKASPSTTPSPSSCRTAQPNEECYNHVMWAKRTGIHSHSHWYADAGLHPGSSFEAFQAHLNHGGHGDCPMPC